MFHFQVSLKQMVIFFNTEYVQTDAQLTVKQLNVYNHIRSQQNSGRRNASSRRTSSFWKHVYQFNRDVIYITNWLLTDPHFSTENKLLCHASALAGQEVGFALGETVCFMCHFRQNEEHEVILIERWMWVRGWRRDHPGGHWEWAAELKSYKPCCGAWLEFGFPRKLKLKTNSDQTEMAGSRSGKTLRVCKQFAWLKISVFHRVLLTFLN